MKYEVEVTSESDAWIADVVNLAGAHTYARNLVALDTAVQEVIRLVGDLDDETPLEINYRYLNVDELALEAAGVGDRREALETEQRRLGLESVIHVAKLTKAGYSVRDISGLLKMSPGRVSQIMATIRERESSRAS